MNARDLAGRLGLDKHPRSWRGDCPACAYPRVFSVKKGKQEVALLYCSNGCDRAALTQALELRLGSAWKLTPSAVTADVEAVRSRRREAALRLWSGSDPAPGTPADRYLAGRALDGLAHSAALRYRGDCQHPEGGRYPALMAQVVDVGGLPIGCHRTYVQRNGSGKAGVFPTKASLGPIWGGAVRLHPAREMQDSANNGAAQPQLVIGEGIESSASAGRLLDVPAWAGLSAGNLAKGLLLPPSVRHVIIAADHDPVSRAGQIAAEDAARRWRKEGRIVRIAMPDRPGADFNDVLRERARG